MGGQDERFFIIRILSLAGQDAALDVRVLKAVYLLSLSSGDMIVSSLLFISVFFLDSLPEILALLHIACWLYQIYYYACISVFLRHIPSILY